jgi:hypothetical protein
MGQVTINSQCLPLKFGNPPEGESPGRLRHPNRPSSSQSTLAGYLWEATRARFGPGLQIQSEFADLAATDLGVEHQFGRKRVA